MNRATCQGGVAPNGGLIVLASPVTVVHREQVVALAARHRLPVVYPYRYFAANGGLSI
jgi:putative ABC transport system substrate-binding protein